MKKIKASSLINGLLPFATLFLVGLKNFIEIGLTVPDKAFYLDTIMNTIALLAFFIPFKAIYVDKYMSDERITLQKQSYGALCAKVRNEYSYAELDKFCEAEYFERKQEFIKSVLYETGLSPEEFTKEFLLSKNSIKKSDYDEEMKKTLLKCRLKMLYGLKRIKRVKATMLLPSTENSTLFDPLPSNMAKAEKKITAKKMIFSILIAAGMAIFIFNVNYDVNVIAILFNIIFKVIVGLWHIFMAGRAAHMLVHKEYFSELAEKSYCLENFLKSK